MREHHRIRPALEANKVPIDELHDHPLNDRTRDARAKAEIRDSLETNGQYRSIVCRRLEDGRIQILAGHGTREQAAELGWTHLAAEIHDGVDDQQAARIVAVDNRTSDLASYADERRLALLEAMGDLRGSGYDAGDMAEIAARVEAAKARRALTDVDDAPPAPEHPTSELGQTWLLGPHRLVVGDGTDPAVVRHALAGDQADAFITDPPYNVNYHAKAGSIVGDHQEASAFRAFLTDLFAAALENTHLGALAFIYHADSEGYAFRGAFVDAGWENKQTLIWVKDRLVLSRQDHHWQHEPILYGWRPGAAHTWHGGRTLTTVLDDARDVDDYTKAELRDIVAGLLEETTVLHHPRPTASRLHPTMKPVDQLAGFVTRATRQGGLVLDSCAGSGSLAIACHHQQRRAALVELDPKYADVICRRWTDHTGVDAVLETTGETFAQLEAA